MKRIAKIGLAAALAATTLAGCSSNKDASECPVKVGFVTDTGGIDDKSFNQGSWEGIKAFAEENGIDESCISYMQSESEADYTPNLSQLAEDGFDLVIAAGYLFEDAMKEVSANFPDTKFFVIDTVVANDNVDSGVFAAEQSSYLVGVAAAMQAKAQGADKVGFIGGMESDLIGAFQAGYEQGVKSVDPNIKVMVDYAGGYDKPDTGQTLAEKQYGAGAVVIYHAAGGTGGGVIKAGIARAEKGEQVWVIGVDRDQYEDGIYGDENKSVILTSALKKVDSATNQVSKSVLDGEFVGGETLNFNISNDGVGVPEENPNLSEDIQAKLEEVVQDIKDGKIVVDTVPTIKNGAEG